MARVTIQDCLKECNNQFEVVALAARRARQLMMGEAEPQVPIEGDKSTVVALREIASGALSATTELDAQEIEVDISVDPEVVNQDAASIEDTKNIESAESAESAEDTKGTTNVEETKDSANAKDPEDSE